MRLIKCLCKWVTSFFNKMPNEIKGQEMIVRCAYSTMHLNKKGDLNKSFYSPQAKEKDGVRYEAGISAVRKEYAELDFIKSHCKCNENPEGKRSYHGLAFILASNIRTCKSGSFTANVISTPTKYSNYELPQHADVMYGFIPTKGEPLPTEINMIIEKLLQNTKLEKDIKPGEKYFAATGN